MVTALARSPPQGLDGPNRAVTHLPRPSGDTSLPAGHQPYQADSEAERDEGAAEMRSHHNQRLSTTQTWPTEAGPSRPSFTPGLRRSHNDRLRSVSTASIRRDSHRRRGDHPLPRTHRSRHSGGPRRSHRRREQRTSCRNCQEDSCQLQKNP